MISMEDESCVTCKNMTEDQKNTVAFLVVFFWSSYAKKIQ